MSLKNLQGNQSAYIHYMLYRVYYRVELFVEAYHEIFKAIEDPCFENINIVERIIGLQNAALVSAKLYKREDAQRLCIKAKELADEYGDEELSKVIHLSRITIISVLADKFRELDVRKIFPLYLEYISQIDIANIHYTSSLNIHMTLLKKMYEEKRYSDIEYICLKLLCTKIVEYIQAPLFDMLATIYKETGEKEKWYAIMDQYVQYLKNNESRKSSFYKDYVKHQVELMLMRNEYKTLLEDYIHDTLTHCYSRAAFDHKIARTSKGALIYLDVNDLKKINDKFGHQSGDLYLQNFANILLEAFQDDYCYRIGGDEFIVICENFNKEKIIEKLLYLDKIFKEKSPVIDNYSFSAGIAEIKENQSSDTIVSVADSALYRAKADKNILYIFA
jgi:diguanylate cyclase (GGDEF)-like protein